MEEGASIELRLVFRAVVISDSELVVQFLRRSGACASSQMCSCKNLTYTYLATFKLPTMGPQHMPSLARCFDGEFLENVQLFLLQTAAERSQNSTWWRRGLRVKWLW